MASTSISLSYAFTLRVNIAVPPYPIGETPSGLRAYYDIKGGSITGPGLDATIQRGGGDSLLQRSDGWANLDIHYPAKTKEGEWLYVRYIGVMQGTEALAKGKCTINPPACPCGNRLLANFLFLFFFSPASQQLSQRIHQRSRLISRTNTCA